MKSKSKLVILKSVLDARFPLSKKSLLEILSKKDIYISERTLDRYIADLVDFHFIQNIKRLGYVKNELIDDRETQLYMQYLNMNVLSQNLIHFSENRNKYNKYLISERTVFKGVELVEPIMNVIVEKKQLAFTYFTQHTYEGSRLVFPLFLKEYQKRWYLMALDLNKNNELRIFGLDRIENLEASKKHKRKIDIDFYKAKFENVIGIDLRPVNEEFPEPIFITIKATGTQPYYFKSLPFHKSQEIIEETENYTNFKYYLLVNYELIQHLRMHQQFIEVVEPVWLRNFI